MAGVPDAFYISPNFDPYTTGNFTWIKIGAYKAIHHTSMGRDDTGGIEIVEEEVISWAFLAPDQILETVNHVWSPWETIASRLAGRGQEFEQMKSDANGIVESFVQGIKTMSVGGAWTPLKSITRQKWKVDTPLVYENTERREYTLEFQLTAIESADALSNIQMVREMEAYSSPTIKGEVSIELPYIFRVMSYPEQEKVHSILNLDYAAITSIQPTYMAPYDENAIPMRISLTVTFKELPPLYSDSFEENYSPFA